jgi:hypothetical protein
VNLKSFARSYEVPDGALKGVVFWLLPYKTLQVQMTIDYLDAIEPRAVYENSKTGERVSEKPKELIRREEKAAVLKTEVKSDWREVYLWNGSHEAFVLCEPVTVAIDFPDPMPSTEAALFQEYWLNRPTDFADHWATFKALIGMQTWIQWQVAENRTRDNPAAASPEMGQAEPKDPLAPSTPDTAASTTATSSS